MKKILLCTGEEQSFDSDMTMFYSNQYNIKNDVMFSTNTIINKVLRNAGFCFVRFAINHTLIEDLEKYDTLIIFESVVKNSAIRYIRTKNPNIRIIIYFRNQFTFSKKRNVSLTYLKKYNCEFDDRGNIGKRYRRQDAIGTPLCVTIDNQTIEDNTVTVRDRDTMEQIRVNADRLHEIVREKISHVKF